MSWINPILLAALGGGVALIVVFRYLLIRKARSYGNIVDATCDVRDISLKTARNEVIKIPWDELTEVAVVTNDLGPFAEDTYFELTTAGGERHLAPCSTPLLERLQKLPGFDNEGVIQAMACTSDARFPCWHR